MYKIKIVTVDDDPDILDVIEATLEDEYTVIKASTGQEGIDTIRREKPDLVLLDYNLPDMAGPDICAKLRLDPFFLHTPILMLTGKGEIDDKVKGLESGVDDYMVKPFAPDELSARVRMLIRRSNIHLDANPLTRLPGNVTVNNEIEKRIQAKDRFAVLYLDLDHFKALNDYYGFDRGDEAIKTLGRIIIETIQKQGQTSDFIGHIGGDDFVVITSIENAEKIAQDIINDFERATPQFFDEKERLQGYILTKDRSGIEQKFGFVSVSIAVITNRYREFTHIGQISSFEAEIKEIAKKQLGSTYVVDRRDSPPQE
ncbi:MAG: response regulator [Candidatus Omnitrophica bacterium]|nr:response regulator [Candidatus Omnitrophota bacterium]